MYILRGARGEAVATSSATIQPSSCSSSVEVASARRSCSSNRLSVVPVLEEVIALGSHLRSGWLNAQRLLCDVRTLKARKCSGSFLRMRQIGKLNESNGRISWKQNKAGEEEAESESRRKEQQFEHKTKFRFKILSSFPQQ